ncbi:uncharacterized protein BDR25DRAFT_362386 [Lindgomyces ingoldianus]|uniref:Uncharacterized protein n=1 Tax=Lindgomyces ingoldianus TaxID=673940 RepID=A0ACB6QAB5_9PLEO|nr:uncharacterized protein BDR25DRAFT_362386 [Lindgomyces ingoldianus]KAF2463830.1 hypothetical protein BDR25DRAFT_362386 [Lindgomyces ingoldianus]
MGHNKVCCGVQLPILDTLMRLVPIPDTPMRLMPILDTPMWLMPIPDTPIVTPPAVLHNLAGLGQGSLRDQSEDTEAARLLEGDEPREPEGAHGSPSWQAPLSSRQLPLAPRRLYIDRLTRPPYCRIKGKPRSGHSISPSISPIACTNTTRPECFPKQGL